MNIQSQRKKTGRPGTQPGDGTPLMCANALLLRFCTNYAYSVSMLDETGFYAPSMAHNALPSRPWLDISGFHGHNSTASKLLRYPRPRGCGVPTRTL